MVNGTFLFPEIFNLNSQLEKMVSKVHSPFYMKELVKRKPFDYHSTSPSEIISCRLSNGRPIYLFCKYSGSHTQFSHGHRGGVEYEAKVYRNVLDKTPLSLARFYGVYKKDNTGLIIQHLRVAKLLKDQHDPVNFGHAARWIGKLHKIYESKTPSAIKKYDAGYYMIWLKAVEKIIAPLEKKHPWLAGVCTYFKENMHLLLDTSQTFIHGEYYTKNILVQKGIVYPIDWESAAIGPGEIDLASLIEGWDYARKRSAIRNYMKARWPDGKFSEEAFRKRLLLVKIYFFLRWIGEYDDPDCWIDRISWFKNFYHEIKRAGYQKR